MTSADLKDGEAATLNERFSLDIAGATVNGASITKADVTVGNLTVHTIDQVLFPPWSAPAKVLTPQQVLAFEGWAPEVINGRLAMLGFLTCLVQEVATGHSFTQQLGDNFNIFAAQVQLWAFASLVPAFSSNEVSGCMSTNHPHASVDPLVESDTGCKSFKHSALTHSKALESP